MGSCLWVGSEPIYLDYHDNEWGRPVADDRAIFEKLCLESFQSGLSWLTILRKRENFRAAFAGFEPEAVAAFDSDDVERLLGDAGIVRNRSKIEATIANARAVVALDRSISETLWSYAEPLTPPPVDIGDVPPTTPASAAMAKQLKRAGFRFLGPTTCYAAMQALGVVNDHQADCDVRAACEAEQLAVRKRLGI